MSDEKLRRDLIALGFTPGPITDGTRKVLEKKLVKLRTEAKKEQNRRRSRRQETPSDSDEGDGDIPESRSVGSNRHASDIQENRSVGSNRHASDIQENRSLGSNRHASDIQENRSLGSNRYTSDIQENRSFGSNRYTSDIQENRSLGSNRHASDIQENRSLGSNRYTSDIQENRSFGSNRYTSDIQENRSLGSNRYTSDIQENRSLGSNRYTSDIQENRSLGSNRYTSDIQENRSLGSNRYTSDIPESSSFGSSEGRSLGSLRYTSDIPERRSLGSLRYTSDIPERRSLGSHSYTSDIPERRSLGSHRYPSDIPESRSLGSHRYTSDIPETRSIGSHSYTSDILDSRSPGFNSYLVDELRHRHLGDSSRDTSAHISNSRTAFDPQSHKSPFNLRQENALHLKPLWSKNLEYYLSRLLRVLCVILVLVFTGILIVKSGVLSTSQDNGAKLLPADCEGKKDPFCKGKQKEMTLQILSELYDFLSAEAGHFECGNPSGLSSKCIPINRAKEHVMNVSGYAPNRFDAALEWLLSSDTHLGIWAKAEDSEELVTMRADVFCVESSRPKLGIVCRLRNALYTAISNLFLALLGIFLLWVILIFLRYHWQSLEEEEKQMFALVDKIIDIVKYHHMDWILQREQNPYLVISHVRDSLIEPKDRKHLKKVWDRAVQFVENDSRVRTESQRVAGADLMVWRWTQSRKEQPR
ncbi:LEM domain-containing protein 2 isoform X2 [Dendrobates tinctorius]|uniref:LEM domain-containing protein 2 isoform X2 n=1 Tax=Dendrobates tinctorius TaxID=92724 RepID=UPI003CC9238D